MITKNENLMNESEKKMKNEWKMNEKWMKKMKSDDKWKNK